MSKDGFRRFTVISLEAGVQSSTLALMAANGAFPKWKIKAAIFADTQAEPMSVYRWLDWLTAEIAKCPYPFPVIKTTRGSLAEDSLALRKSKKTGKIYLRTLLPMINKQTDGKLRMCIRKCTTDYKIVPIQREIRGLIGKEQLNRWRRHHRAGRNPKPLVRQLIGISLDEFERIKTSRDPHVENVYPLIDLKITRQDCLKWMAEHNYPRPPRSACRFCPFRSDQEWRDLRDQEPDEFIKAVRWERLMHRLQDIDGRLDGNIFCHHSGIALDKANFGESTERDTWGAECEGMCGM